MQLALDQSLGKNYHSKRQVARVMTEGWVERELYCPRCGAQHVSHLPNNSPVGDFMCPSCKSQYELKSKNGAWGDRVNDGAYATLISRITSSSNPDFLFMDYSRDRFVVRNLMLVPKYFFVPSIVEKRKPLPPTARRAGWVGCTISLANVPRQGRIQIVDNELPVDTRLVRERIRLADKLAVRDIGARRWLMDVLQCVNSIAGEEFALSDVYAYEGALSTRHPDNNNVRPKIRQQLQVLRDRGLIEFLGCGRYRKRGLL